MCIYIYIHRTATSSGAALPRRSATWGSLNRCMYMYMYMYVYVYVYMYMYMCMYMYV